MNKKTVLIIEDDKALINVLQDKLISEGFLVLTAKDGEEGLEIAVRQKPNLILLDVIMPKMNGVEMLRKLRENKWGETIPVILLSNDDNPEHIRETLKDNATDYLIKADWELKDIIRKIKETMSL